MEKAISGVFVGRGSLLLKKHVSEIFTKEQVALILSDLNENIRTLKNVTKGEKEKKSHSVYLENDGEFPRTNSISINTKMFPIRKENKRKRFIQYLCWITSNHTDTILFFYFSTEEMNEKEASNPLAALYAFAYGVFNGSIDLVNEPPANLCY